MIRKEEFEKKLSEPVKFIDELFELIPNFLENVEGDSLKIRAAIEKGNYEDVTLVSHRVKGSAGSYGFPQIEKMMVQIETSINEQKFEEVEFIQNIFEKYLRKIKCEFEKKYR